MNRLSRKEIEIEEFSLKRRHPTMRKVLTRWMALLIVALLTLVSLGMYSLVQRDLQQRTLLQLRSQVVQHWHPTPPDPLLPPAHRWRPPWPLLTRFRPRALPLVLPAGWAAQNWDDLATPFIHVRYYDLKLHKLVERGGPDIGAPPERPELLRTMLQQGQDSLEYRSQSGFEGFIMWANLVRDGRGKPVGILELGLGSKPTQDLLETLVGSLILAGIVSLLAGVAVTSVMARHFTRPLESLALQMQRVSGGDFNVQAERRGPFELQSMALNFDRMVTQLRQVFQSQRQFVADASHELKTPLTSVQTMVELLREHDDMPAERKEKAFQVIERELNRVNRLVHDLLALSRLDELDRSAEIVDLARLAQKVCSDYAALHPNLDWTLECDSAPAPLVDPEAGERALRNLLDNALAHTPAENRVVLRLRRLGEEYLVEVADEGSGIPPQDLPHVTRRFYRSDASRSRLSGGSGLGLAIVSSWVERTGGRLELESTLGKGTVVRMWLPVAA